MQFYQTKPQPLAPKASVAAFSNLSCNPDAGYVTFGKKNPEELEKNLRQTKSVSFCLLNSSTIHVVYITKYTNNLEQVASRCFDDKCRNQ
jgi:hypothetical protein